MSNGFSEREDRANGAEKIFEEIMSEVFCSLVKDINLQSKEAQCNPNYLNMKKSNHWKAKLQKKKILNAARGKQFRWSPPSHPSGS